MASSGLVGRDRELAELLRQLDGARSGRGGVVLVDGDAGVGKTSLADALTEEARRQGAVTAWGACLEGEGSAPYRPWLQILSQLGQPASRLAAPGRSDATSRFRLFADVTKMLETAAGEDGLLLIIDDLHAADVPSLRLFEFVAAEIADSPMLMVGLHRSAGAVASIDLTAVVARVRRERATERLTLGGLSPAEIEELATRTLGPEPDGSVVRLVQERSEGNPLFARELLSLAGSRGQVDAGLPHGIREVIRRRFDGLPEPTLRAVQHVAVLGREFSVARAAAMIDDDPLDVLAGAIGAGLLTVHGGHTLRFDHVLTRDVAYDELPVAERPPLHARAAQATRQADGEIDEVAHHLREAAALGCAADALEVTIRAAERATSQLAHEHAAYQYRAALDVLPLAPDSQVRRDDLLLDLARAEFRSGRVDEAWRSCRAAADLGRAHGDAATVADAATVLRGISNSTVTGEIHALCREALAMLRGSDEVREARVLAQLAISADPFAEDVEPDTGTRALRLAEATGDPDARFLALQARRTELTDIRKSSERLSLGDRAIRLGREAGREEYVAWGHTWRMDALWELSRRVQLDAELAAFATVVDHLREPLWLWRLTMTRASLALAEGRFAAARDLAEEGLDIGRRGGHQGADFLHLVFRDHLGWHTGARGEIEQQVRRFTETGPFLARSWLAAVLESTGRYDEAEQIWRSVVPHLDEMPRRAREWIIAHAGHAELCVRFRDTASASKLYAELLPFRALQVTGGSETPSRGPVALYLGKLATALEDWEAAQAHLESALDLSAAMGSAPFVGVSHLELGRMLRARPGTKDARAANAHLKTAQEIARDLGMPPLAREASTLLGQGPGSDGPLSAREQEVAALVGEGLSNRQIAHRLHISERTAENHVTHILNKLGVGSRAQIATWHASQP